MIIHFSVSVCQTFLMVNQKRFIIVFCFRYPVSYIMRKKKNFYVMKNKVKPFGGQNARYDKSKGSRFRSH